MNISKNHIVIVDNHSDFLADAERILSNSYSIKTMENCNKLIDFLANNPVYLLISSISLKKQYFFSLLADIHQKWFGLPVILSYDDETTYQNMHSHYLKVSQAVIKKPFNPTQLLALVELILGKFPFTINIKVNYETPKI